MPKQKSPLVEIRWPIGGLDRSTGFDQQPPYTTPHALNVRPFDTVNLSAATLHGYRHRGGARPGLSKAFAQRIGTGPVQMLGVCSVFTTPGALQNILLAVSGGTLYQSTSGTPTTVSGTLNATARQLRGCQVGQLYYIADYRTANVRSPNNAPDGTIASGNRLSATSISDWTTLGIDQNLDVVWIAGSTFTEQNIFPITAVASGYITFGGTMTNQTGGVNWQIGRIAKVWDPFNPTAALTGLMGTLPVPNANYVTGTVSSTNGVVTLSGGSWSGVPAPTAANSLTLTIPNTSGIGTQSYLVASLNSNTQLTLIDQTNDADCTGVTYTISWTTHFVGIPPLNCPLCCNYRGRLTLSDGWHWFQSRLLAPWDWDFGYDPQDPSRAMAGSSSDTGECPDFTVALMPHGQNSLIFGCDKSLWILNGDPAYGGTISNLSHNIGVVGPASWCNLPDGGKLILSRDGVYQIPAQATPGSVTPVSRPKLPAELLNVDWSHNTVSMEYDVEARGVHLAITPQVTP